MVPGEVAWGRTEQVWRDALEAEDDEVVGETYCATTARMGTAEAVGLVGELDLGGGEVEVADEPGGGGGRWKRKDE